MVASPIEIPDALLQLIFTLVFTPAALARCSLVCKDWRRILSSVALWRRITHKMCTLADSPMRYGGLVVRLKCPYGQFDIPLQEKAGDVTQRTWIVPVPDGWHTFRQKFTPNDDTHPYLTHDVTLGPRRRRCALG